MFIRSFAATIFFALFTFALSVNTSSAQTVLVAGDIAVTGFIATPSAGADEFSFVLLRAVAANTAINFTDSGWLPNPPNPAAGFRPGETFVTWTASGAMSAGCEVRVLNLTTSSIGSSGFTCPAGTVTGTSISLNGNNGDQLLAFQGAQATPTFIAGIHTNVYTVANGNGGDTTAAAWDGGAPGVGGDFSASALPPGLTTGTNAIWLGTFQVLSSERGNGRMRCGPGIDLSNAASARAAINNQANWLTDPPANSVPASFTLPTGCAYLRPTAAGVSVSGRVIDGNGNGLGRTTVTITDLNGNARTALTSPFGYYRFDDVGSGQTYVVNAVSKRYQFTSQTITVGDELSNVDFVAVLP